MSDEVPGRPERRLKLVRTGEEAVEVVRSIEDRETPTLVGTETADELSSSDLIRVVDPTGPVRDAGSMVPDRAPAGVGELRLLAVLCCAAPLTAVGAVGVAVVLDAPVLLIAIATVVLGLLVLCTAGLLLAGQRHRVRYLEIALGLRDRLLALPAGSASGPDAAVQTLMAQARRARAGLTDVADHALADDLDRAVRRAAGEPG